MQRKSQVAKDQIKLAWKELNPTTFGPDLREAYEKVQRATAELKATRKNLEGLIIEATGLPDTHRMIFSYKFERLSAAIDTAKPKHVGSKAVDFETLKAAVRQAGS